ncbi:MAG TPA: hypothetical protein VJZ27_11320, partial [Aggregatilineales bacterium]|nr:hypothetical protein [Aggregatilineales bacterium]
MTFPPVDTPPEEGSTRPMQPMQPTERRRLQGRRPARQRDPIRSTEEQEQQAYEEEMLLDASSEENLPRAAHRQVDPLVAYMMITALAIGISPLDALVRYVVLWTLMSGLGTIAYLLGGVERMREAKIDDLIRGVIFGFLSSFPFLLVFGSALATVSRRMFDAPDTSAIVTDTWAFMALAFVLPLSETLFFRGGMQAVRSIILTSALATLWSAVLFFPHMELGGREVIGVIMLLVFGLLNFLYSYMRFRNGL